MGTMNTLIPLLSTFWNELSFRKSPKHTSNTCVISVKTLLTTRYKASDNSGDKRYKILPFSLKRFTTVTVSRMVRSRKTSRTFT